MSDRKMATSEERQDRQAYYTRAQNWAEDRERALGASRRLAWSAAAVAAGIAMLEALALAMLTPLKENTPYTILVDRQTGFAQVLKGADRASLAPDWALTQSLLAQYVTSREGFDITSIENDYRKVGLWSADLAKKQYLEAMLQGNPAAPFKTLPRTSIVKVEVKSISPLQKDTALVRFDTERLDQGQIAGHTQSWAAIVRYRFVNAPMTFEDRLVDPLGFQVVHYRKDPEAVPLPEPTASVSMPEAEAGLRHRISGSAPGGSGEAK